MGHGSLLNFLVVFGPKAAKGKGKMKRGGEESEDDEDGEDEKRMYDGEGQGAVRFISRKGLEKVTQGWSNDVRALVRVRIYMLSESHF